MKLTSKEFRAWENKCITFLGMSGVGKTHLANMLRKHNWFHFSADYRIGTRYLDEPILDNIKQQAMQIPFLRDLFHSDSIYISNNITVDNLKPVSSFLGKLGDPEQGGLGLAEFKRRQALHHEAEIAAMKDVPVFIQKAREIYGYMHFINDSGGSVCELDDPGTLEVLNGHTVILYLKATKKDEQEIIRRAGNDPKPLYYREPFLNEQLDEYMGNKGISYAAQIEPDEFVTWMFPRLFYSRLPRYQAIADQYGYTVTTDELSTVTNETDFLELVGAIIDKQS